MVVVMEGVVGGGGPHRDALFVNGILGRTHNKKSGEFRRIEVAASERGVSCSAGARCGQWNTQRQQKVQEQQEIESAVKAGWHRQMAEGQRSDSSGRGKWQREWWRVRHSHDDCKRVWSARRWCWM